MLIQSGCWLVKHQQPCPAQVNTNQGAGQRDAAKLSCGQALGVVADVADDLLARVSFRTSNADDGAALAAADEADGLDLVWIIGGASLYEQALDVATLAEVTVIDTEAEGDTHAPVLDERWRLTGADPEPGGWHTAANGLRHRFERWERDA